MIAVLRPFEGGGNPYIDIVKEGLNNKGIHVISLRQIISYRYLFNKVDVAIFNWYENIGGNNSRSKLLNILKKKLIVQYLRKIKRTRIIVVLHNKSDHTGDDQYSTRMLKWLLLRADRVVIHCHETIKYINNAYQYKEAKAITEKCRMIPHPNYIDAYKKKAPSSNWSVFNDNDDDMKLLYFGRVKKYKNSEILIGLAKRLQKEKIHIYVVGEIDDDVLCGFSQVNSKNLTIINNRIPDDEIWGVIERADCVVLPYDLDTVLNSGAVILALSVGKNVICPNIGTIMDFPEDLPYMYFYSNKDEHLNRLYDKTIEAYIDFRENREIFYRRADSLHKIVKEQYSKERVSDYYFEVIQSAVLGDGTK